MLCAGIHNNCHSNIDLKMIISAMIIVNVNATEDENDDESFQEVMVERMHAKGTVEGLLLSRCCLPLS